MNEEVDRKETIVAGLFDLRRSAETPSLWGRWGTPCYRVYAADSRYYPLWHPYSNPGQAITTLKYVCDKFNKDKETAEEKIYWDLSYDGVDYTFHLYCPKPAPLTLGGIGPNPAITIVNVLCRAQEEGVL